MFCSRHTFFMTIYGLLNIRWLCLASQLPWIHDITFSSNELAQKNSDKTQIMLIYY